MGPIFLGLQSQAQNLKSYDYIEINENVVTPVNAEMTFGLMDTLKPLASSAHEKILNILNWTNKHNKSNLGDPYMRLGQFGAWINDPDDETCYNTRGKVLQRDSQVAVGVSLNNRCKIEEGLWYDPYTQGFIKQASEIQIDHFVPLKNAYVSGAYRWTRPKRCHYANYIGNNYHLLSVSGHENMSKGDRSPAYYVPPNTSYRCEYVKTWLKIKLIWGLNMTPDEALGIQEVIKTHHCDPRRFTMSQRELTEQRQLIADTDYQCRDKVY